MVWCHHSEFRGREVKTTGDGFLATFDGPARAVQCACLIRDSVRSWGVKIGASLHTRAFEVEERRSAVGPDRVWVRSLHQVPSGAGVSDRGLVVILPGLGLPGYTLPTAAAVAARGVECAVLGLQSKRHNVALVMAGPTFPPEHRRVARLLASTPLAYRKDRLREIDVKEVLRARGDLVRMVLSGLGDTPESRVAGLAAPLTVTAGIADAYAPVVWLDLLARSAVRAAGTRTSLLGGSHNNLYTHPHEMAGLVVLALDDARAWA